MGDNSIKVMSFGGEMMFCSGNYCWWCFGPCDFDAVIIFVC